MSWYVTCGSKLADQSDIDRSTLATDRQRHSVRMRGPRKVQQCNKQNDSNAQATHAAVINRPLTVRLATSFFEIVFRCVDCPCLAGGGSSHSVCFGPKRRASHRRWRRWRWREEGMMTHVSIIIGQHLLHFLLPTASKNDSRISQRETCTIRSAEAA